MRYSKWVNQGDQRYMALGECPTDGKLLVRLKFRKADDCTWSATRLTYQATDSMESYYKAKAAQPRKRGRDDGPLQGGRAAGRHHRLQGRQFGADVLDGLDDVGARLAVDHQQHGLLVVVEA